MSFPKKVESTIQVFGASTHNLKNIDVEIPRGKFVVITGPSGSGKSSLAIDTIYAEGQRQFIESLSIGARQYFQQMPRSKVDRVVGLPPTLCIDQRHGATNPRSTVGTHTEIHDHLRVLFARVGDVMCFSCGEPIEQQTIEQIKEGLLALDKGSRLMILAPLVRGKKGKHDEIFQLIRKERLIRVRVDGEVFDIDQIPVLDATESHQIEAVADRIILREDISDRLVEALQAAVRLSAGLVSVMSQSKEPDGSHREWREQSFNTTHACSSCGESYTEIEPRTFSFNSPYGACEECSGVGHHEMFDQDLVVPDRGLSIAAGAIRPWHLLNKSTRATRFEELASVMKETGFDLQTPLAKLTDEQWLYFWAGRGNEVLGLSNLLNKEYSTSRNGAYVEELGGFRRELTCQQCDGTRLGQAARNVFVAGQTIGKLNRLSISELLAWFKAIELSPAKKTIASELINEIERRLEFLIKVGLKYLSLERSTKTLSGGEFQRVRLAGAIGNGLNGVCYVLDEPSIGLHQRDNSKLIEAMRELQRNGNSLLVVEHDQEIMTQADWIIDIGPGAGDKGGEVVGASPPPALIEESNGVTAQYLSGRKKIEIPQRRAVSDAEQILIRGAAGFNLKKFDASIPLGVFVCVTGVSGSGKSTLINETLFPAVAAKLGLSTRQPQSHEAIEGIEKIDKLIQVDQAPIGRTPRGCLATHCGVLGEIRKIFAATRQAKQKGFTHSRFSFNSESGRCSECRGLGSIKLEVNFLPATYVTCPSCQGRRFNEQTLRILYRQKSIADVLEMEVTEAIEFFDAFSKIVEVLGCFERVGLGYISLGQPSTTLSGGEAQRIKLATELARRETGKTLYLLDEPTTGLHFEDIRRLLSVLQSLVDKGNSVIVIEHNLDVIKCADWVIDLGPDGGAAGGEIVGIGTPEMLAKNDRSYTGQYLKPMLG